MKNILFRRHGDVSLSPITKEEFEKSKGEIKKHDGAYIVARGEATGSTYIITVQNPQDFIVKEEGEDRMIALLKEAVITHTHDHEPIVIEPGYYRQIQEREVDHFANSIIKKVID
jgi:hypothetical protein